MPQTQTILLSYAPLMVVSQSPRKNLPKFGADPNLAANRSGLTALHFAVIDNQHEII